MSALQQDVRYGLRMLARSPGFTATAAATLALGIGTTTAIFSFVNAVVLRPLPYKDSDRLVMVLNQNRSEPRSPFTRVSAGDFLDWQAQNDVFENMAAFTATTVSLSGGGEPERLMGAAVTSRFFETLAVAPIAGHTFLSHEGTADAGDVVVIRESLWRGRFNSNPAIVGKSITLDGRTVTIVGIMPVAFTFPRDVFGGPGGRFSRDIDVWTPLSLHPGDRGNYLLQVVARLKPGVDVQNAQAAMDTIAHRLEAQVPGNKGMGASLASLHEQVVGEVRPLLLLFLGAVACLLLIACTNVANLLLGRSTARQREMAIRAALGSGRWRIVRQLLIESVLLGLVGGLFGLLLAGWCLDAVRSAIPAGSVPRMMEVGIDRQALAFTLAISFASGVLFGIIPALRSAKTDVSAVLKATVTTQTRRSRLLNTLVVAEVAVAFVLLAGAGLLMKSFLRLTSVDPGFQPRSILTLSVTLPEAKYPTTEAMERFAGDVLERLQHAPGVLHAGAVNWLPLAGPLLMGDFTAEGIPPPPRGLIVSKPAISPDYFDAMGIPLLRGRSFTAADGSNAPRVAIISAGLARRLWPDQDAIGKHLKLGFGPPEKDPWMSIVGVAGDIKQTSLADRTRPAIYVPIEQAPRPFLLQNLTFVARTALDPSRVATVIRREIRAVDPDLPFDRVETMETLLADSVAEPRFRGVLLTMFASAALILVAIGILGVLAYSVARRTREIGVRMALGAQRVDVVRLVLLHAMTMVVAGVSLGVALSLALTGLLTKLLFQVRPTDPTTFVLVAVVMIFAALIASYVPARRATSVDPLIALRAE